MDRLNSVLLIAILRGETMATGASGLEIIKHFEGLYLKTYKDPAGILTIGYGHIGSEAYEGNEITAAKAEALLAEDLETAEKAVEKYVSVALSDNQYDALVSFTFNLGSSNLTTSTLLKKLNNGDPDGAAAEFIRWNKATVNGVKVALKGLTRRRKSETHLFKTGDVEFFLDRGIADPDEPASPPQPNGAPTEPNPTPTTYPDIFSELVGSWGLKHFRPSELLAMGGAHRTFGSPGYQKNSHPPQLLWSNIRPSIEALDSLRVLLDAPIHLLSVYRNDEYNQLIGGVTNSYHTQFMAIDFYAKSISGPAHWASVLRDLRDQGKFSGGIGIYDTFVHIDCRGTDANW